MYRKIKMFLSLQVLSSKILTSDNYLTLRYKPLDTSYDFFE